VSGDAAHLRGIVRHDARTLLLRDPEPTVDLQDVYRAVHAWALRGLGYGLGDHPATSGEIHVLELLAKRCDHPVVFDVGANAGEWALMARSQLGEAYGAIHCFEPSGEARQELVRRFERILFAQFVHPFGLSDGERTCPLHTDALGSGMASVHPRRLAHFGRALDVEERVALRRLDEVCRDLRVPRVDLLKLDVEGHELAALRGAGDMLTSGAIGMIQWEMGGCNLDARTTWQDFWYLLAPHYDIYRVLADGLAPVPSYREQDEVYICANFCAVWRARSP
jgi:FkbM family methyltransferase